MKKRPSPPRPPERDYDGPRICQCGDAGVKLFNHLWRCEDCFLELTTGVIRQYKTRPQYGGIRAKKDDISPWQENTIRQMEDLKE